MKKKLTAEILGIIFLVSALLLQLDNYRLGGGWFEIEEVHHEAFTIALLFGGFLMLYLSSKYSILKIR